MPIPASNSFGTPEPHRVRTIAESFGTDAAAYHRLRPRYPAALAEAVLAALPGRDTAPNARPDVLDVGCGTGIAAEGFLARGCRVLGVDPDARMAEHVRSFTPANGRLDIEVARFEDWDPAGRAFDLVISGQTWHWVDPKIGSGKAKEVLRPDGRIALFWNAAALPADLVERIAEACPGIPRQGLDGTAYDAMAQWASGHLAGTFTDVTTTAFPWSTAYDRDDWIAMQVTTGVRDRVDPTALRAVLPASIDVEYRTVLVTGVRTD